MFFLQKSLVLKTLLFQMEGFFRLQIYIIYFTFVYFCSHKRFCVIIWLLVLFINIYIKFASCRCFRALFVWVWVSWPIHLFVPVFKCGGGLRFLNGALPYWSYLLCFYIDYYVTVNLLLSFYFIMNVFENPIHWWTLYLNSKVFWLYECPSFFVAKHIHRCIKTFYNFLNDTLVFYSPFQDHATPEFHSFVVFIQWRLAYILYHKSQTNLTKNQAKM